MGKVYQTTRSPKTTARLTQRNMFEQQYFGWPNQPSSGLDVTQSVSDPFSDQNGAKPPYPMGQHIPIWLI